MVKSSSSLRSLPKKLAEQCVLLACVALLAPGLAAPVQASDPPRWSLFGFVNLLGQARESTSPLFDSHPDIALLGVDGGAEDFDPRFTVNLRGRLSKHWSFMTQLTWDDNTDDAVGIDNKTPEWAFLDYHTNRWQVRFGILPLTFGLIGPTKPDIVYPFQRAPISIYGSGSTQRVVGAEAVYRFSDAAAIEFHVGEANIPLFTLGDAIGIEGAGVQLSLEPRFLPGGSRFLVGYQYHEVDDERTLTDETTDFYASLSLVFGNRIVDRFDVEWKTNEESSPFSGLRTEAGYARLDFVLVGPDRVKLSPQYEVVDHEGQAELEDFAISLTARFNISDKSWLGLAGDDLLLKVEHHFAEYDLIAAAEPEEAGYSAISLVIPFSHRW